MFIGIEKRLVGRANEFGNGGFAIAKTSSDFFSLFSTVLRYQVIGCITNAWWKTSTHIALNRSDIAQFLDQLFPDPEIVNGSLEAAFHGSKAREISRARLFRFRNRDEHS